MINQLSQTEIVLMVSLILIGVLSTFKVVKYTLRFLYLNNNRSTLYHMNLSDPHSFTTQVESGIVKSLEDIPSCSMHLVVWACVASVCMYSFPMVFLYSMVN